MQKIRFLEQNRQAYECTPDSIQPPWNLLLTEVLFRAQTPPGPVSLVPCPLNVFGTPPPPHGLQ